MRELVIGSRGSQLALYQSNLIRTQIEKLQPGVAVQIEIIKTSGDKISAGALAQFGTIKGLFVKEIEEALLEGSVDLAVHSLKDVPTELPAGLCLAAIPLREDPRDALIAADGLSSYHDLAAGARVGTGSLRRQLQLRRVRPEIQIIPVRGNVDTRIGKMGERNLQAIVLALAGLKRLGLADKASYIFPRGEVLPAIGQGALAIETRSDDEELIGLLAGLEHPETRSCTQAERSFLSKMGGGCQVPMAAHAWIDGQKAHFSAFVAHPDGSQFLHQNGEVTAGQLENLALHTADHLLSRGADRFLQEFGVRE